MTKLSFPLTAAQAQLIVPAWERYLLAQQQVGALIGVALGAKDVGSVNILGLSREGEAFAVDYESPPEPPKPSRPLKLVSA